MVTSECVVAAIELVIGAKLVGVVTAALDDVEITISVVLETFSSVVLMPIDGTFSVVPSVSSVDPKTVVVVIDSTEGPWLLLEGIEVVD